MWAESLSYLFSLYTLLYQAIVPCPFLDQLPANTVNRQQYFGKWYFAVAVSHREADIQNFKAVDNMIFNIEEKGNNTLLLTGKLRMGDECITKSWTYYIHPGRDDLELEGRSHRKNLLWGGKRINCANCIIFQEVEPPLSPSDSVDSLHRFMLYTRERDADPEVVSAFLKNSACKQMLSIVKPPKTKGVSCAAVALDTKDNETLISCFPCEAEK